MGVPAAQGWDQQIAKGLGVAPTPAVIRFLHLWSAAEGGDAANNPFNTTQPGFGATGNYNSVGVKNYATPGQGIQATIHTLQNGRYGNILDALKKGTSAVEMAQALANSPWGTGALVLKMLGAPQQAPLPGAPLQDQAPVHAPLPGLPSIDKGPTLQQRFNAAGPSASTVGILGRLGGMAGKAAQAAQAPIALPSALGNQTLGQQVAAVPGAPQPNTPPLPGSNTPDPGDTGKWVVLGKGANRAGVSVQQPVFDFVSQVAQVYGKPLTIGTGTNHNEYVAGTHRESAHWTGLAADIPASGSNLTRLGQDALIAAGANPSWARNQQGGLFNIGGKQIIFNSLEGGNHFNHLHVGIRE